MAFGKKGEHLVRGSARLYGTLMGLYPEDYKEEYAREMRLAFGDLLREEHSPQGCQGRHSGLAKRTAGTSGRCNLGKERYDGAHCGRGEEVH